MLPTQAGLLQHWVAAAGKSVTDGPGVAAGEGDALVEGVEGVVRAAGRATGRVRDNSQISREESRAARPAGGGRPPARNRRRLPQ